MENLTPATLGMIATLVIFNITTVVLLVVALHKVSIGEVVAEKRASPRKKDEAAPDLSTSYSRVTGVIGAVVLAAFIWGIANVILFKAFTTPKEIAEVLDGVATFIAAGAALFLPYAANQVREAFKPRA